MVYFYWIAGTILALAWFSRILDAALGMPSVADVSRPEWDRDPITPTGNPRVSIIVPARNEEETIEKALKSLLALDYNNYEVIAVNDRSTDRTGEIMDEVANFGRAKTTTPVAIFDGCEQRLAESDPPQRTPRRLVGQNPCNVDRRKSGERGLAPFHRR